MRVVRSVAAMQRLARQWRAQARSVAFVPTMGFLHAGHVSLVHRARKLAGPKGIVVLSIYVNPTQFAAHEDLSRYPRDFARDKSLCAAAGVDVIFAPESAAIYPAAFSTYVVEENLSRSMEGASRPTHFRGVTTVVAKLFNLVLPDFAVFGAKDFQQATVIRRMVRDLNFPVKIIVAPTAREPDGLALSSRNKYLSAAERRQAVVLSQVWRRAKTLVAQSKSPLSAQKLSRELSALIAAQPAARLDYLEFFDPQTLLPVRQVKRGTQLALAVFIGKTRLIDNATL